MKSNLNIQLPFVNTKFVLSITSIAFSLLILTVFFSINASLFVGTFLILSFILGSVSIILSGKDSAMLSENRNMYSEKSIKNHNTGKLLALIAFVVSVVVCIIAIYLFYKYGTLDMDNIKLQQNPTLKIKRG